MKQGKDFQVMHINKPVSLLTAHILSAPPTSTASQPSEMIVTQHQLSRLRADCRFIIESFSN
jgi:hypothetical protein